MRIIGKVWMQRHYFFPPTATSTMVIVSLPNMSTTFTAIFTRFLSTSVAALVNSNERSFFVRKLCHSFSKMKSPVQALHHLACRLVLDADDFLLALEIEIDRPVIDPVGPVLG